MFFFGSDHAWHEHSALEMQRMELLLRTYLPRESGSQDPEVSSPDRELERLHNLRFRTSSGSLPPLHPDLSGTPEPVGWEFRYEPLERLRRTLGLSYLDCEIFLLVTAPYLNSWFSLACTQLQSNENLYFPTLNLLDLLFADNYEERLRLRERLSSHAPLIRHGLIRFDSDRTDTLQALRPSRRYLDFFLGDDGPDPSLGTLMVRETPGEKEEDPWLDPVLNSKMESLKANLSGDPGLLEGLVLSFTGPAGSGKKRSARALCRHLGKPLISLNPRTPGSLSADVQAKILREAKLFEAAVLVPDLPDLHGEEEAQFAPLFALMETLHREGIFLIVSAKESPFHHGTLGRIRYAEIVFPYPGYEWRVEQWKNRLNGNRSDSALLTAEDLAARYRFTAGQIRGALEAAETASLFRDVSEGITDQDLMEGSRSQCSRSLAKLAIKVDSSFGWEDLILPDRQLRTLQDITSRLKFKYRVLHNWNFRSKLNSGRGLNALFTGESGTGKTMAAGVMARELGLELYRIDLSTVVSKYIGDTEKNLSRIFAGAENANAILFFDEADSLFGKRSEVKDAHDRYANIEVGYLLQKMEEYEGMTILATNMRENMDKAFLRRLHFIVDFPFPDPSQAERIWRSCLPSEAPVEDVDFAFLSRKLHFAGGSIKNIVLSAAFQAAREEASIGMKHLLHSAQNEYAKQGKLLLKADMGEYSHLLD